MRSDLPTGTVTFLFTDVEGSTKLLHELGAEGYAEALAEHRRVVREACVAEGGVEVDTQGDAFFFAFATAPGALAAAAAMTEAMAPGPIQVRVGLHTGTPHLGEEGYVGGDVHRAARIAAAGHGGQVLVSASTASLAGAELRDLGEHRFKDLSAAEHVYQLGDQEFPSLTSLDRTNLPVPVTPFLGRERELAEVVGLLAGTRLLTLTGPGGTGKTRLATHAAGMSADAYPDGVWWVPLETLRDPALVLESVAQALGAKQELGAHVGDQRMLVLLDCFEGVTGAAPDIASLLSRCPNLDLVVTSRERLNLTAEQEYPVPAFAHEEAVGFFAARARTANPDFEVDDAVAEICARLEDMPLALELAAAQVKVLSPQQILERGLGLSATGPRDLPDRQRTLAATIDWSHDLLTEDEQRLFRRMSVFAGGCTVEMAEDVAEADLVTLQALVDKSLVRRVDDRFRMLDTIREYASQRLAESGEIDVVHERLAQHLIALATKEGAPLFLDRQVEAFARFELEHGNARAVMSWGLRRDRHDIGAELASLLGNAWGARGHGREARGWFDAILESRPAVSSAIWARFLIQAVDVTKETAEPGRTMELAEELVESMSDDDAVDPLYIASALADISDSALVQGDLARAREYGERSLAFRTARGLPGARALTSLAELALEEGDLVQAERLFGEAAAEYERIGHELNHIGALEGLGEAARRQKELDHATKLLGEALDRSVQLGDRAAVGDTLEALALVECDRGRMDRAAKLWGAGKALRDGVTARRPRMEPDLPEQARAEGAAMTLEEAVALASRSSDA